MIDFSDTSTLSTSDSWLVYPISSFHDKEW